MLVISIFLAAVLIMALGVVFLTGKGLAFLYSDREEPSEEELSEYAKHTNPVHMCRFIGVCLLAGSVVGIVFAFRMLFPSFILDVVTISLAAAFALAGLIVYIVLFRYVPMKKIYFENKKAQEEAK